MAGFAHGRDGRPSKPLPAMSVREEPQLADLAQKRQEKLALERAEKSFAVVLPMHGDGLGADPGPRPLDADEIQSIGFDLTTARPWLESAARTADRPACRGLHDRLKKLLNEVDLLMPQLQEWGTGGGDEAA